jgi:hypothetical protein
MMWRNVSEFSAMLAPGALAGDVESRELGRRAARAVLIVAIAAFWIWGLIR